MSNKSILQSNNDSLSANNLDLQNLIDQVNALPEAGGEQATPAISVSSNGLITATAGTKSSTHQLAFQPAKTVTPGTASQIAVSSGYFTGGNVIVTGDTNLVAANIKSGVSIFGVSGTLQEGGGSGEAAEWSENEDAMVTGTLSSYMNNRVSVIRSGAFAYTYNLKSVDFPNVKNIGNSAFQSCDSLTTVSFPLATSIGGNAFQSCSRLTTVSFPQVVSIGNNAFQYCSRLATVSFPQVTNIKNYTFYSCTGLTTVSFPLATSIGTSAFLYCTSLTTISFPLVTNIGSNAFQSCSRLTTVSFPQVTNIGNSAFQSCSRLTTVSFPLATSIGSSAFQYCSNLTTVNFPQVVSIGNNAFSACSNLTTVSFPLATSIGNYTFRGCRILSAIYLANSSICTLSNSYAFSSTPYAGYKTYFSGTPYIYVPASLVSAYQSATNWTQFSSYFSAIESLGGNLITFTVSVTECQAEEGMTWAEWVESEYNTIGVSIIDNRVYYSGTVLTDMATSQETLSSDYIVAENQYWIM